MPRTRCPVCSNCYENILEHVKRTHAGIRLTPVQVELAGLFACECGMVTISPLGVLTHQGKTKCAGWARGQRRGLGGGRAVGGADGEVEERRRIRAGGAPRLVVGQAPPANPAPRRPLLEVDGRGNSPEVLAGGVPARRRRGEEEESQRVRSRREEGAELNLAAQARPPPPVVRKKARLADGANTSDDEDMPQSVVRRRRAAQQARDGQPGGSGGGNQAREARFSTPRAARRVVDSDEDMDSDAGNALPPQDCRPSPTPTPSPSPEPANLAGRLASLAACATVYKPLPPSWAKPFVAAAAHAAAAYVRDPTDLHLFNFLALPKVALAPALAMASGGDTPAGKAHLAAYPRVGWPAPSPAPAMGASIPARVAKAVQSGKLGRAARILGEEAAVAVLSPEVMDALRSKHPEGEENPFGNRRGNAPSSVPEVELLHTCFSNFKPDTAPGVSGWTVPLLGRALGSEEVVAMLALLTKQVASGTAPGGELLCMSRLTPLVKSDGGIRPIAVGDLIWRLIARVLVRHYSTPSMLLPWQFGVGTPGGVEPVTRALERALDGSLPVKYTHVTSLDFSNAFNSLSRKELAKGLLKHAPALYRAGRWAYNLPSDLVLLDHNRNPVTISSSEGVRQGDPLGPLFFSIGARDVLAKLADNLGPGHALLAYLDDVYILSVQEGALHLAQEALEGNPAGLSLNMRKCKEVPLREVERDGLACLGTCVGSAAARLAFLEAKVEEQIPVLQRIKDLPGQEAFLLLRMCVSNNLRHLQRSLRTDDLPGAWSRLDSAFLAAFHHLRASPRRLGTDAGLLTLPARLGGVGIFSHAEVAPHARAAMAETADRLLRDAFAAFGVDEVEGSEDGVDPPEPVSQRMRCQSAFVTRREALLAALPESSRPIVIDNSSPLACQWMSTIPFSVQLRVETSHVAFGLMTRTLCPGQEDNCHHCAAPNIPGHDDVCTIRPRWRVAKHEVAKKLLATHLKGINDTEITLEVFVPGSELRTDLRLTGPGSFGSPVSEYDLTIVSASTLAGREPAPFAPGAKVPSAFLPAPFKPEDCPATSAASLSLLHQLNFTEAEKRAKYAQVTASPFHPIVISTGGTLSPSTIPIFAHWAGLMPTYSNFSRLLSLCLLRGRARFFAF